MVAQSTVKRHENKNRKQRPTNKKSQKNNRKIKHNKKIKAMGNITLTTIPEMDRWDILIPNLICHVNPQHPWLKITHHIKKKEPHNAILSLKSPDMFQTLNLTED